jgi:hypothetical protein
MEWNRVTLSLGFMFQGARRKPRGAFFTEEAACGPVAGHGHGRKAALGHVGGGISLVSPKKFSRKSSDEWKMLAMLVSMLSGSR